MPRLGFPLSIHYRKGDLQCRVEGCTETVSVAGTEVVPTTKCCPFRKLLVRWLLLGIGWLCVSLGAVGVVLPLLPTTPFLLLAAACFARASLRFYDWLLNTPVLGQHIEEYRAGLGIPLRAKIIALSGLWITILSSVTWLVPTWPARVFLLLIAAAVSVHLLRLPTRRRGHPNQ